MPAEGWSPCCPFTRVNRKRTAQTAEVHQILGPARRSVSITASAMVRIALGLSLLVALVALAVPVLCHPGSSGASGTSLTIVSADHAGVTEVTVSTTKGTILKSSPSVQEGCHQGVAESSEALPVEHPVITHTLARSLSNDGHILPALADPVRDNPDHLVPSLTALSISRT